METFKISLFLCRKCSNMMNTRKRWEEIWDERKNNSIVCTSITKIIKYLHLVDHSCVRYLLSFYFNLFLDVILVKNSIFISSSAHFKFYKINKVCIFKKHIFLLILQLHEVLDTKIYICHIRFMGISYLWWYHIAMR